MIKPMGTNVVIKVDKNETMTKGGIILPGAAEEESDSGIVICTSINRPSELKPGDHVKFLPYSGQEFKTNDCEDGYKYRLVPERNIFCIIEDDVNA